MTNKAQLNRNKPDSSVTPLVVSAASRNKKNSAPSHQLIRQLQGRH